MSQTAHAHDLPALVTRQGEKIKDVYTPPPLDNSMPFNMFIDWHMQHSTNHRFAVLTGNGTEGGNILDSIAYQEIGQAVHKLGRSLLDSIPGGTLDKTGAPKVIGILAKTDTLLYVTTILALLRAGFVVFPLFTRNSEEGLIHLIKRTDCHSVVGCGLSSDANNPINKMLFGAQASLAKENYDLQTIEMADVASMFPRFTERPIPPFKPDPNFQPLPSLTSLPGYKDWALDTTCAKYNWTCLIVQSSGSTGLPKPIPWNQRLIISWSAWPWYGERDVGGAVFGSGLGIPESHASGLSTQIGMPLTCGTVSSMWLPGSTPPLVTPSIMLDGIVWTKATYVALIPLFIEPWAKDPESVKKLKQLEVLAFGGGDLSKTCAETLQANGINVQVLYGMTEGGVLWSTFRKGYPGPDFLYGAFSTFVTPRLVEEWKDVYRVELIANDSHLPGVLNIDSEKAFNTGDLIEEHPTRKGWYKFIGRANEVLTLSDGHKVNPGPMERTICACSSLRGALMFGDQRDLAGLLVEPKEKVTDHKVFIDTVWEYVQLANAHSHHREKIGKELIVIADVDNKPFVRSSVKGTPLRADCLKLYEKELNDVYGK